MITAEVDIEQYIKDETTGRLCFFHMSEGTNIVRKVIHFNVDIMVQSIRNKMENLCSYTEKIVITDHNCCNFSIPAFFHIQSCELYMGTNTNNESFYYAIVCKR